MRETLTERSVVVTGGAGGLGLSLGRAFARRGARVTLLDRDGQALAAAVRTLVAEGLRVESGTADVTDLEACCAAIEAVVQRHGGVDVLVNNAGISHHGNFAETEVSVLRRVVDVNLFGAVHCTKAALPSLRARRGRVVAISSVAGFAPLLGRSGYAASKHAMHGFFDTLRAELEADGVSVTVVCPAYVDTGIDAHALSGDGGPLRRPKRVVGKLLSPDDVAAQIVEAVLARRERLLISGVARAAWWISRLAPGLYRRLMTRSHREP